MNKEHFILIVEDSPTQAEKLRHILEQNDCRTKLALNGAIALEMIKSEMPAIIISDIVMPEMDGFELCRTLKENTEFKSIPFIILTSLSDPQDVIKGLQAGADNFLTKPYNEQFLLNRVQYILANQEIRKGMISAMGIEIVFAGQKYFINSDRIQIIDLLLSTYENAIQKNKELAQANDELTEMHQQLERKNSELEKLNADKNRFLGIAAHDIRNPVGSILSASIILEEELENKIDPETKELISMIKMSSDHVIHLLNDLLDISVIESGKLGLTKTEVDLSNLIYKNLASARILANVKNIKINFQGDKNFPLVNVDRVKIEQVMNNLISNAIKFSHENREVTINLKQQDEKIIISVRDEGQGIPDREIALLFKPFPKTSVLPTSGEKSTGLGLSIVKKIVTAHDGEVWLDSKTGEGSTFYVRLPIH